MPIQHLTPEEAKALLEQDPEAVYVDVRSVQEFAAGHPEAAKNIPLLNRGPFGMEPNGEFLVVVKKVFKPGQKLLIGCQVGGRSLKASMMLDQNGFTQVFNVVGGFGGGQHPETGDMVAGWKAAGLPVNQENGEGVSYESLKAR